jgi:hypothetical protein
MNCESCVNSYIESSGDLSLRARIHLATCVKCSKEIARMERAEALLRNSSPRPSRDLNYAIMAAIKLQPRKEGEQESERLVRWIVVGFFLIAGLLLMPFGEGFGWGRAVFGNDYALPMSLVLGGALTVFALIFVFTHIESLSEFLRRRGLR